MGIYYDSTKKKWEVSYEKTDYQTDLKTDNPTNLKRREYYQVTVCTRWFFGRCTRTGTETHHRDVDDTATNDRNRLVNDLNNRTNNENRALNTKNTQLNEAYKSTLGAANTTNGGDYVAQRDIIRAIKDVPDEVKTDLEDQFKTFYRTEKLQTWDTALGAKPLYGAFDAKYYQKTYPQVENE